MSLQPSAQRATIRVEGPLGVLRLNRPEAANALDEAMLAELSAAFVSLSEDDGIEKIVIQGGPKFFMVGADIGLFIRCILAADLDRILEFTQAAHTLLDAISACHKPVVAWVEGAALGAGLELALACHHVVAAPQARFAFPETGLGIYPGMGGTQRTPRRIGIGLAKWMIATGATVTAAQALELGLIDVVDAAIHTPWQAATAPVRRLAKRPPLSSPLRAMEALFGGDSLSTLCQTERLLDGDPVVVRALLRLRAKAPLALKFVDELVDLSTQGSLANGLKHEFASLRCVFASEDARRGLLAPHGARITFVGR